MSSNTTQITSSKSEVQVVKSSQSSNNITLRSAVLKSVCSHRRHLRMDSLRTLVLSDNLLTKIQLTTDDSDIAVAESDRDTDWNIVTKSKLIFPNLTLLNLSNNILKKIPESIKDLSNLSVLNISGTI